MPMTEDDLKAALEQANEYPDPIDALSAVMIVCDGLELEPLRVLAKIRMGVRLTEQEYIIEDLLTSSQSNIKRSLQRLHRAVAADELISRLGENDDVNC